MPIRAMTFDLDGTLAEVRRRKAGMWRGLLRHPRALPALPRVMEGLRGARWADLDAELVARTAARAGVTVGKARAALADELDGRWPRLYAGARPPAPVQALLDACDAAGLPRAVVSDHPGLDKLEVMGLGGWSAVVDCRRLGALKPLPDGLAAAATQLGVPTNALLHVGDRADTDGAAAAAAGAAFIDVTTLADPAAARAALGRLGVGPASS